MPGSRNTVANLGTILPTTRPVNQPPSPACDIAKRFASALDSEDYIAAESLIADGCEYSCRGELFVGPQAIVASYRGHGDSGAKEYDSIDYESSVESLSERRALIHFFDHLRRKGNRMTFRCDQEISVDESGMIVRIQHVDLPGQREALEQFRSD